MPNITIEIKLMQYAKQCLGMYYTVSGFSQLGQELVKVLQIQWHIYMQKMTRHRHIRI